MGSAFRRPTKDAVLQDSTRPAASPCPPQTLTKLTCDDVNRFSVSWQILGLVVQHIWPLLQDADAVRLQCVDQTAAAFYQRNLYCLQKTIDINSDNDYYRYAAHLTSSTSNTTRRRGNIRINKLRFYYGISAKTYHQFLSLQQTIIKYLEFNYNKKYENKFNDLLISFIINNSTLSILKIRCSLYNDEFILQKLFKFLLNNTTISSLTLGYRSLSHITLEAMSTLLQTNQTLIDLTLECVKMPIDSIKVFTNALRHNHTLRALKLYENALNGETFDDLCLFILTSRTSALTSLDIAQHDFRDADIIALIQLTRVLLRLQLYFHECITLSGAEAIRHALISPDSQTQHLRLACGTAATSMVIGVILSSLEYNRSISTMDVAMYGMDDADATALADVLRVNTTLTSLSVIFVMSVYTNENPSLML